MGLVGDALLVEEQEALAGLACPANDRVGDLWVLTTHVVVHVLSRDRLVTEPELVLREDQRLDETRGLVAKLAL